MVSGLLGPAVSAATTAPQPMAMLSTWAMIAVGLGAVLLKQDEALSPAAFVITFFVSSLLQQVLETRSQLSGLPVNVPVDSVKSSQVIS